jgi:O-antigen/teichoic acid export membrane protein
MEGLYRKVSGTFLIKVLGLGIAFVFQIIIGRVLKPELYGQYTMLQTYVNVLSVIAVLGMDRNLIKEVAIVSENKTKSSSLLVFSMKISLLIFLLLSIFVFIFHNKMLIESNMIHLFILMLLIQVIITILDGFLQGAGLIVKVTFLNILLNNFIKIILFVALVYFGTDGLYSALYSFILSEITTITVRIITLKKMIRGHISLRDDLSHEQKNQFIKYSTTVALIGGMGLLLQNVDKIILANLLNFTSVGIYKVAQNYVALIAVFIAPFVAFWPVISKLYSENRIDEIEVAMKKIVKVVTCLVVPMFFIFLSISKKLLFIFGQTYVSDDANKVLIVLAFAFLIDAVSGPIGAILTMTKYAKYILINNIISLILNVVLTFIFIKIFGIVGVAIGTGISIIVNNLISIIEVKVLLGIISYDYKFFVQIVMLSILNFLACKLMIGVLEIGNIYLYILSFGILIYAINGLILLLSYRKVIMNFYYKGTLQ